MLKAKKAVKKKTAIPKKSIREKRSKKITKKKNKLITVHSPINPTQEFVIASELADDDAIEAELKGKAMEHYVYSFKQNGAEVTGLTVAGVNEMSRLLTRKKDSGIKIRIVPESIKIKTDAEMQESKGISVVLMAENMLSGETSIGAKFEPYQKKGRKGLYENTFALEKAVSKAERNAKRKLIPEKLAIETIRKFVNQGNVQAITPPTYNNYNKPIYNKPTYNKPALPAPAEINHLSSLVKYLATEAEIIIKDGIPTKAQVDKMMDLYNNYTGDQIKSLRVGQPRAKEMLHNLLSSPMMANKK